MTSTSGRGRTGEDIRVFGVDWGMFSGSGIGDLKKDWVCYKANMGYPAIDRGSQ